MENQSKLLWSPDEARIRNSNIEKFRKFVESRGGRSFPAYKELWQWSVDELESFWEELWHYFEMDSYTTYDRVLDSRDMPGCRWFPGAELNFAQQVLYRCSSGGVAIRSVSEVRGQTEMGADELIPQTLSLAGKLRELGVRPGDRVAAYMPAIPEATVAMLAATAVGAVWSACSPDFGVNAVLERFEQIEPKVLFVVDGYRYAGRDYDRRDVVSAMQADMDSLEHVIGLPYLRDGAWKDGGGVTQWDSVCSDARTDLRDFAFEQLPFDHPLWILYSSGTTGKPKGIVQSHGGILLELLKLSSFHCDMGPGSTSFWMTTTGWMLWNALHGALLTGGTMVIYDGHPSHPGPGTLWSVVVDTASTFFGCSAAYINALTKTDLQPSRDYDLSGLESISVTGSPLSAEGFAWVYEAVREDVWLSSLSGGTDVCSGFVGGVPTLSVRAGEIQARLLGVAAFAFDGEGNEVEGEVGELVITRPMPSMPVYFWNDPDMKRYRESYFDVYPGVWRHGDYIEMLANGGCIISGRSDSTLNRFGIRIGTAEIYRVLDGISEIQDALIVNLDLPGGGFFMPRFVKPAAGSDLDDQLKKKICAALRSQCSPRHVPDEIYAIPEIPMTLTGKKLEVPVKKILSGVPLEKAANPGSLANPESLDFFVRFAGERSTGTA